MHLTIVLVPTSMHECTTRGDAQYFYLNDTSYINTYFLQNDEGDTLMQLYLA